MAGRWGPSPSSSDSGPEEPTRSPSERWTRLRMAYRPTITGTRGCNNQQSLCLGIYYFASGRRANAVGGDSTNRGGPRSIYRSLRSLGPVLNSDSPVVPGGTGIAFHCAMFGDGALSYRDKMVRCEQILLKDYRF